MLHGSINVVNLNGIIKMSDFQKPGQLNNYEAILLRLTERLDIAPPVLSLTPRRMMISCRIVDLVQVWKTPEQDDFLQQSVGIGKSNAEAAKDLWQALWRVPPQGIANVYFRMPCRREIQATFEPRPG